MVLPKQFGATALIDQCNAQRADSAAQVIHMEKCCDLSPPRCGPPVLSGWGFYDFGFVMDCT